MSGLTEEESIEILRSIKARSKPNNLPSPGIPLKVGGGKSSIILKQMQDAGIRKGEVIVIYSGGSYVGAYLDPSGEVKQATAKGVLSKAVDLINQNEFTAAEQLISNHLELLNRVREKHSGLADLITRVQPMQEASKGLLTLSTTHENEITERKYNRAMKIV